MSYPSIEILEENHQFPCVFVFKAIGKANATFVEGVLTIVCEELNVEETPEHSTRTTTGGRHTCVTIKPVVEEAVQVLAIYQRLHQLDDLVMLM